LDEITLQEAWVDEHFESQTLRLSGATVGWRRLTIPKLVLKAPMVPALEAEI
jgi:hypothetical protein